MAQQTTQSLPIQMSDGTIVASTIKQDEYGQWGLKIKYPKVGRSHFYSMVNYIDDLFEKQHPTWAELLHKQSRGEL